eukprot:m.70881 g.70881  ORF g.70881 m.70881 type:complete len:510 (+) comp12272_c0_seq1:656-2185(+)
MALPNYPPGYGPFPSTSTFRVAQPPQILGPNQLPPMAPSLGGGMAPFGVYYANPMLQTQRPMYDVMLPQQMLPPTAYGPATVAMPGNPYISTNSVLNSGLIPTAASNPYMLPQQYAAGPFPQAGSFMVTPPYFSGYNPHVMDQATVAQQAALANSSPRKSSRVLPHESQCKSTAPVKAVDSKDHKVVQSLRHSQPVDATSPVPHPSRHRSTHNPAHHQLKVDAAAHGVACYLPTGSASQGFKGTQAQLSKQQRHVTADDDVFCVLPDAPTKKYSKRVPRHKSTKSSSKAQPKQEVNGKAKLSLSKSHSVVERSLPTESPETGKVRKVWTDQDVFDELSARLRKRHKDGHGRRTTTLLKAIRGFKAALQDASVLCPIATTATLNSEVSGQRCFQCRWCERVFVTQGHCDVHERTHRMKHPVVPKAGSIWSVRQGAASAKPENVSPDPVLLRRDHKSLRASSQTTSRIKPAVSETTTQKERAFQCTVCLSRFAQSDQLHAHRQVHKQTAQN